MVDDCDRGELHVYKSCHTFVHELGINLMCSVYWDSLYLLAQWTSVNAEAEVSALSLMWVRAEPDVGQSWAWCGSELSLTYCKEPHHFNVCTLSSFNLFSLFLFPQWVTLWRVNETFTCDLTNCVSSCIFQIRILSTCSDCLWFDTLWFSHIRIHPVRLALR